MTSFGTTSSNRTTHQDSLRLTINLSHSPRHVATHGLLFPDALPECLIPKAVSKRQFGYVDVQQQKFTRVYPRSTPLSTLAKAAEIEFKLPRALLGGICLRNWEYESVPLYELTDTTTVEQMISEVRSQVTIVRWSFSKPDEGKKKKKIETVELELFTIAGRSKRAEDMLLSAVHGYRWAQRGLEYLSRKATRDEVKIDYLRGQQKEYMEKLAWAAKVLYPSMLVMPLDTAPQDLCKLSYLKSPGARLAPDDYEIFINTYLVHQAWLPRHMAKLYLPAILSAEEASDPTEKFQVEPPATAEELGGRKLIDLAKLEFERTYCEPGGIMFRNERSEEVVHNLWHQLPQNVVQKYLYRKLQRYRDNIGERKQYARYREQDPGPGNVLISFVPHTITCPDISLRSSHSFRVSTGAVLWGQLYTVLAGSQASGYDGNGESIPKELTGGTIIQRSYRYRCAARNGVWGIWRAYVIEGRAGEDGQPDKNHLGWVVCHQDADPKDILMRAASVTKERGIGGYGGKEHIDRDVLAVNRYDWSWHCPRPEKTVCEKMKRYLWDHVGMRTNVKERQNSDYYRDEEPEKDNMVTIQTRPGAGRFMFVDAGEFGAGTVRAVMEQGGVISSETGPKYPSNAPLETVFIKERSAPGIAGHVNTEGMCHAPVVINQDESGENGEYAFGTYLSMPSTEHEFGWMVFSGHTVTRPGIGDEGGGTKRSTNIKSEIQADELIGFVYDGIYQGLQGLAWAVEPVKENL
ncbi:hypothetical protein EV426DRAFT_572433 [Tirmania nivea]|nr:hypothetical protein EV426DRAFT_572433 [Tirmania nivea]